jgi:hypothetical protein
LPALLPSRASRSAFTSGLLRTSPVLRALVRNTGTAQAAIALTVSVVVLAP